MRSKKEIGDELAHATGEPPAYWHGYSVALKFALSFPPGGALASAAADYQNGLWAGFLWALSRSPEPEQKGERTTNHGKKKKKAEPFLIFPSVG